MTIRATNVDVFPGEDKIGLSLMVEVYLLPAAGVVALSTVLIDRTLVPVVLKVAGKAVLWGIFKRGDSPRSLVTVSAA